MKELDLIEAAFEGDLVCSDHWDYDDPEVNAATDFCADHCKPKYRLLAIMQNIIDHGGKFRPKVRYTVE